MIVCQVIWNPYQYSLSKFNSLSIWMQLIIIVCADFFLKLKNDTTTLLLRSYYYVHQARRVARSAVTNPIYFTMLKHAFLCNDIGWSQFCTNSQESFTQWHSRIRIHIKLLNQNGFHLSRSIWWIFKESTEIDRIHINYTHTNKHFDDIIIQWLICTTPHRYILSLVPSILELRHNHAQSD